MLDSWFMVYSVLNCTMNYLIIVGVASFEQVLVVFLCLKLTGVSIFQSARQPEEMMLR